MTDVGHFMPLLLCFCLIAHIDRWIHCGVKSHRSPRQCKLPRTSVGHFQCAGDNSFRSQHDTAQDNTRLLAIPSAVALRWKGVPRSAPLGDCRVSHIMAKLSFCNAQMRLSLVLQLLTGSRRDAVSNRGSICCGM